MKSEMTPASFCCGLIVCNKSRRRLISNWDSEDVAFIKNKIKNGVNLVKWQIGLILKTNKQTTPLKKKPCVISLVHNFDYKLNCGRVRSCKVTMQMRWGLKNFTSKGISWGNAIVIDC